MEKKILQATASTPEVILDPDNQIFRISGESRPEDIPAFYQPILHWLDDFGQHISSQEPKDIPYEFNLSFEYFDSLSAKFILDICKNLSRLRSEGNSIHLKWHYEKDDEDMQEVGRQMSRISKMPFEFVEIKL